ncbi:sugar phosphate isomerase/epimerase [bacterium]|nr:sugar phosphate isomerase/epimerase [bacterium]
MKISLMTYKHTKELFTDLDALCNFLDTIKSYGITGVEPMFLEAEDFYLNHDLLHEVLEEILKRSMCIPNIDLIVNHLKPGGFEEACEKTRTMINSASVLKPALVMTNGNRLPEDMCPEEARKLVALSIDKAIEAGKKHDLDIATEAFGISYDIMSTSDMLEDIFSMLKNSPLYFVADSANSCYGGESSVVALEKFWDILRHVHVKDIKETQEGTGYPAKGDNRWLGQAELGTGIAGVKEFAAFLKSRSYNGWYSLETYWTDSLEIVGKYANTLKQLLSN